MEQKIVIDKGYLFKDGKEIKLSERQIAILTILQDNLLHSHYELLKKARFNRSVREKSNLNAYLIKLNTMTRLKIRPLKGAGYHLLDKIYVND